MATIEKMPMLLEGHQRLQQEVKRLRKSTAPK